MGHEKLSILYSTKKRVLFKKKMFNFYPQPIGARYNIMCNTIDLYIWPIIYNK